jgi:hypothetical protein
MTERVQETDGIFNEKKKINYWLDLSIQYANQRSYLDDLFKIYPTIPDGIRSLNEANWKLIKKNFEKKDNVDLIKALLNCELFPLRIVMLHI